MPDMHWRMIGPFRGGRTRAVAGVPDQPNVFYIGQVNGGVWKSTDYGRTWAPIFDGEDTQSVGAIAVAPSNSNIVYVASGEGLHRPDLSVGDGIYRSTDAGKTWTHLGLQGGEQIPALVVDPTNPDRLFAAVLGHPYGPNEERGIFRSDDGGKTWKKLLYKGDRVGGVNAPFPLTVVRGEGCRLWDADGHEYIDVLGEYTAGIYGHSHPVIRAAIDRALNQGWNYGGRNANEAKLAKLVADRMPSIDLVRFTKAAPGARRARGGGRWGGVAAEIPSDDEVTPERRPLSSPSIRRAS